MNELKIGDVVRLKSGGPNMIIENIDKKAMGATADKVFSTDTLYAWVQWFDKNKNPKKGVYALTSLEKAPKRRRRASVEFIPL